MSLRIKGTFIEAAVETASSSITLPEVTDTVILSATGTLASVIVGADGWGKRRFTIVQTSGITTITNVNSPTTIGQINLRGADVILNPGDSVDLYCKADGTLLLVGRGPVMGRGLWANAPIELAMIDPNVAFESFSDFIGTPCDDTTNIPTGWALVADAGSTGGQTLADAVGGTLAIYPDGDDNDEAYLSSRNEIFKFAASKPMWFEARVRLNENGGTAGKSGFICGVSDTVAANSLVDGGTLMTSFDGALFVKEETTAKIDFVGSNAGTQDNDELADWVDGTWYRLGFVFDPGNGTTGTLTPYINGTAYTAQDITLSGLEEMHIVFGAKMFATTTEASFEVDWYRALQIR